MATDWKDSYAQCPFFLRSGSSKITCCGVDEGSRLTWEFQDKADKEIQMRVFCCGKYQNYEVFQMLNNLCKSEE